MLLSQPSFHFDTLPFSYFLTHTLYPMSFLTTLISSFPLLSYSIHHITLSSSHFRSHLISSHHTSHHHSHSFLSQTIHVFILTTFHAFSHHLICITLITSHIHLSFILHHPHSILLPFHHSRIFYFSTHPFHHGALRDFLKTHFHSFHLSYPPIHYSNLLFIIFHLHHLHHHSYLLFILIRIYDLYSFISIYSHSILHLIHFNQSHSYPFPYHFSHSIPFHHSHSFPILLLTPQSLTFSDTLLLHHRHSFISSISILIPLSAILHIPFISFLRFPLSCLNYEISIMFVRIVVITCIFVVLIGNTRCQLDVIAFVSDDRFESGSIE